MTMLAMSVRYFVDSEHSDDREPHQIVPSEDEMKRDKGPPDGGHYGYCDCRPFSCHYLYGALDFVSLCLSRLLCLSSNSNYGIN